MYKIKNILLKKFFYYYFMDYNLFFHRYIYRFQTHNVKLFFKFLLLIKFKADIFVLAVLKISERMLQDDQEIKNIFS